jgi:lipopolysaccharide transport system permease protein
MAERLVELWRGRELMYFLAWRDVKVRYKQAVVGIAWAIIQPLFAMLLFTFFFGRLAKVPSGGVPYPLFSYSGLVLWTYFGTTISQAGNSLVGNSTLITKVYFPRLLLPTASALASLLDLAIGLVFLVGMLVYYRVYTGWSLLFAPLFVAQMVIFALGASMLLAAMNVRYRDIKHAIPFGLQLMMFVSPIIYPIDFLPKQFRGIAALNPMAGVVEGFRASILPGYPLDWHLFVTSVVVTALIFVWGAAYFIRTEAVFADIV